MKRSEEKELLASFGKELVKYLKNLPENDRTSLKGILNDSWETRSDQSLVDLLKSFPDEIKRNLKGSF